MKSESPLNTRSKGARRQCFFQVALAWLLGALAGDAAHSRDIVSGDLEE